jgi:hypothetical protein
MSYKLASLSRKIIVKKIEDLEAVKYRRPLWDTEEAKLEAYMECEKIVANIIRRSKRREKKEVGNEEVYSVTS